MSSKSETPPETGDIIAKKDGEGRETPRVIDVPLAGALSERYLAYAISTITSRSLPDLRDGLKPVHRRLLYAMRELKLQPGAGFKKCARIVGDVMGKFHPHGDAALYEAMVRLAQDFSLRYPLVEGQGNFGNIDGDNAAAMRYTEARLTPFAAWMLDGIDENATDWRPTYDGSENEPVVLPGRFPNLLANGASGIAVGMATSIPPHNLEELCIAAQMLIRDPQTSVSQLMTHIAGPDFPTGGLIYETPETLQTMYSTGRGTLRLRARWRLEKAEKGRWCIVVHEIPFQVQKSRLLEKIAELAEARRLPLLGNVRDESDEKIRLVLEPKSRTVEPLALMAPLFRLTDLETRFSMNFNVLNQNLVPGVMHVRDLLLGWLDHRMQVVTRGLNYRLEHLERRLLILDGYLIGFHNLDQLLAIIRTEDHPKEVLMATFNLQDLQAEALLNLRLRRLQKLEEKALRNEHKTLRKERTAIRKELKDPLLRWQRISDELETIKKECQRLPALCARRTGLAKPEQDVHAVATVRENKPLTVICSQKGWLRSFAGHLTDVEIQALKYKENDAPAIAHRVHSADHLLVLGQNGRCYTLHCEKLPGGRGMGEPLTMFCDLTGTAAGDRTGMFADISLYQTEGLYLLYSRQGKGFKTAAANLLSQTRTGKQIMTLGPGDTVEGLTRLTASHVACLASNKKIAVFPCSQIPEHTRGSGVRLQKLEAASLVRVLCFDLQAGLTLRKTGRKWTKAQVPGLELMQRGALGHPLPRGLSVQAVLEVWKDL